MSYYPTRWTVQAEPLQNVLVHRSDALIHRKNVGEDTVELAFAARFEHAVFSMLKGCRLLLGVCVRHPLAVAPVVTDGIPEKFNVAHLHDLLRETVVQGSIVSVPLYIFKVGDNFVVKTDDAVGGLACQD